LAVVAYICAHFVAQVSDDDDDEHDGDLSPDDDSPQEEPGT